MTYDIGHIALAALLGALITSAPTRLTAGQEDIGGEGGQDIFEIAMEHDRLHGTLSLPDREGVFPAALIIPGSGPVDRDGNFPGGHNESLEQLAHALGQRGIAALRVDKRGIGQSAPAGPREEDLRLSTYVDDAIGWVSQLEADAQISEIFIVGHSEGALVGTLAAQRADVSGLVLIAGASLPAAEIIDRQLKAAGVPENIQARSREITDLLVAGEAVADIPSELEPLYRTSVQPYLMSWLPIHPAEELEKISQPALIVQGTTDLQISPEDAERLAAAKPDAEFVVIEGMNHVLKTAPAERAANIAAYNDPDLQVHAELIAAITDFVGDNR